MERIYTKTSHYALQFIFAHNMWLTLKLQYINQNTHHISIQILSILKYQWLVVKRQQYTNRSVGKYISLPEKGRQFSISLCGVIFFLFLLYLFFSANPIDMCTCLCIISAFPFFKFCNINIKLDICLSFLLYAFCQYHLLVCNTFVSQYVFTIHQIYIR